MTDITGTKLTARHPALGLTLIIGGLLGLLAAFQLTLDKFAVLANPHADLNCNYSRLVQCGANLNSWQGEVFGFPNPLLGLMMFVAPVIVGVAILAKVSFPKWFWGVFNLGMLFAISFVAWLITQSIFSIHTLCPWCMLAWVAVIPMSLATTLSNAAHGVFGRWAVRVGEALVSWVPLMSIVAYLIIALVAQLQLDIIHHL